MRRIHLSGRVRYRDGSKKHRIPDYQFLPKPTSMKTDYPTGDNRYSIMIRGKYLYWDVTWEGDHLCKEVERQANSQLFEWRNLKNIYQKIQRVSGTDEYTKELIRTAITEIRHWSSVLNKILKQLEEPNDLKEQYSHKRGIDFG